MIKLKNFNILNQTQRTISNLYDYKRNKTFCLSGALMNLLKISVFLSNIFLIKCAASKNEENDTIETLKKEIYSLGTLSYQELFNEIKNLKYSKIFAFELDDENNKKEKNIERTFELFKCVSIDTYKDKIYVGCMLFKGGFTYYNNRKHIISSLFNLRLSIYKNTCYDFSFHKKLIVNKNGWTTLLGPMCLNIDDVSIFFEKIKKEISEDAKNLEYFILITNSPYSDIEISVIYKYIIESKKSIIWITKDENFMDPINGFSYGIDLKNINLKFVLYDFKDVHATCSITNEKTICIKRYRGFINEKLSNQSYYSFDSDFYNLFRLSFEDDTVKLDNSFIKLSFSKQ